MERIKRILLLLALSYWLMPQSIAAQEKYEFKIYPQTEPAWVVEPDYEVAERLYQEWLTRQKPKTRVTSVSGSFNPCNCVSYARYKTGINVGPIGLAKYHPVNSTVPIIGGLIVTYESWRGHLGVVVGISATTVTIDDYNYSPCAHTIRELPLDSSLIKGYYK